MTIQLSTPVRNARLDIIATTIGSSAKLIIYSGEAPTNCASPATGTILATMNLPTAWMSAASSGSKSKTGTWNDLSADATGIAGYFRIYDENMSTCGIQGSISGTGGGGDMILDNISIVAGQSIIVNSFVLTDGNQ